MEKVIELMEAWKRYLEEGQGEDLGDFGQWLSNQKRSAESASMPKPPSPGYRMEFGRYFGTLTGFAEAWERIAFRDLPIKGFSDFDILNQVRQQGNPTKNTIAQNSTLEQSTLFESIKRLQKKGFLRDEVDATDRRVKRVHLTPEGEAVIEQAVEKAFKMSHLIVGDLSEEEIVNMIGLLKRLNAFHAHLHKTKSKDDIKDMYDL